MSEMNISQNSTLFILSPENLIFHLDTDDISELSSNTTKISKETEIKIINNTTDFIAIKIKTTKRSNYIMSPASIFVLTPKEEKNINIRFVRNEGEKLKLKNYKVLFEGIIIKEEEKDLNIKDLFDKYTKNDNKINTYTIQIESKFLDKNGNASLSMSNSNLTKITNISNNNNNCISDSKINNKGNKNKDFNLIDLSNASDTQITWALIIAIFIGIYILS